MWTREDSRIEANVVAHRKIGRGTVSYDVRRVARFKVQLGDIRFAKPRVFLSLEVRISILVDGTGKSPIQKAVWVD